MLRASKIKLGGLVWNVCTPRCLIRMTRSLRRRAAAQSDSGGCELLHGCGLRRSTVGDGARPALALRREALLDAKQVRL